MQRNQELDELIAKKTNGSLSVKMAWENSIQQCVSCGMPTAVIRDILLGFASPASVALLSRLIANDPIFLENKNFEKVWEQFSERCDDSNYDEYQWFKGIEHVLNFVRVKNMKTSLCTVLGYLTCAEEFSLGSNSSNSFEDVVQQMIEEYGFDG